jgi:hypothetical protein
MGFLEGIGGKPNVQSLKEKGDVEGLVRALSNKDPWVRCQAARALGELRDQRAVAPLLRIAESDTEPRVRTYAVEALTNFRDQRSVTVLIGALDNPGLRDKAAESLGAINDPSCVAPLLEIIRNPGDRRRLYAAKVLGLMGGPGSVQPLKVALEDKSWAVHHEAAKALETIARASENPSVRSDISAALEKAERERSNEYRKFRNFESLKAGEFAYSVTVAAGAIRWPEVCCLCLDPAETTCEVTAYDASAMRDVSVQGLPYCRFCYNLDLTALDTRTIIRSSAVEMDLHDSNVTFRFKNAEYGKRFEQANQTRQPTVVDRTGGRGVKTEGLKEIIMIKQGPPADEPYVIEILRALHPELADRQLLITTETSGSFAPDDLYVITRLRMRKGEGFDIAGKTIFQQYRDKQGNQGYLVFVYE